MRKGVTVLVLAGVGLVAALALADALRPTAHSSAPPTSALSMNVPTRTGPPTVQVVPPNFPRRPPKLPKRFCGSVQLGPEGEFPLLLVEVLKGDASCEEARRVMKAHYTGGRLGSWTCHGPEGSAGCGKGKTEAIRAYFESIPSPAQEVLGVALRWARSFARGRCGLMTQPGCESVTCERVGGVTLPDCTPVDAAYRKSFEDARVEEIASKGRRVAARFSNGELIRIVGFSGGNWMVHRVGWTAGASVFE